MKASPKVADKFASIGTLIAAMGCAGCFPALGSLAASLGLGFLAPYEGILISRLLPALAGIALGIHLYYWWQHRVRWRGLLSLLGPVVVLLTLYLIWRLGWSTYLFYAGLALMLAVSLLDIIKPPRRAQCQV